MAQKKDNPILEVVDTSVESKPECFVIMPISDPDGYEKGHFARVYQDIFIPAITKAGFKPVRADDDKAANLIQIEILRKLLEAPMAICDLSSRNPNVLFELGIRQAFDKPVVLVQEFGTPRIFDISVLRTIDYHKQRIYHEVLEDQSKIADAITETYSSCNKGTSINSLVKLLSLGKPANLSEIGDIQQDPTLQLILAEITQLKNEMRMPKTNEISHRFPIRENECTINEFQEYAKLRDVLETSNTESEYTEVMEEIDNQIKRYEYMVNNGRNCLPMLTMYKKLKNNLQYRYTEDPAFVVGGKSI